MCQNQKSCSANKVIWFGNRSTTELAVLWRKLFQKAPPGAVSVLAGLGSLASNRHWREAACPTATSLFTSVLGCFCFALSWFCPGKKKRWLDRSSYKNLQAPDLMKLFLTLEKKEHGVLNTPLSGAACQYLFQYASKQTPELSKWALGVGQSVPFMLAKKNAARKVKHFTTLDQWEI